MSYISNRFQRIWSTRKTIGWLLGCCREWFRKLLWSKNFLCEGLRFTCFIHLRLLLKNLPISKCFKGTTELSELYVGFTLNLCLRTLVNHEFNEQTVKQRNHVCMAWARKHEAGIQSFCSQLCLWESEIYLHTCNRFWAFPASPCCTLGIPDIIRNCIKCQPHTYCT